MSATGTSYWLWDYGAERTSVKWALRAVAIVLFFVAWQIVGLSGRFIAIVPVTTVLRTLATDLKNDTLVPAALETFRTAAVGFLIAAIIGLPLGFVIGVSRLGRWTLEPLVNVGVVTPMTILIPIMGVYLGFGFRSKVVLVALFAVFVIVINTAAGVRETSRDLLETARSFQISGWSIYTKVVLPNALPYILTGLRLGIGRSIQGAIIADLLLESTGLGKFLLQAGGTFNMAGLLAGTLFTVMIGASVMVIARRIEAHLLRWMTA